MMHLVLGIFENPVTGLWIFLSIGAVSLFVIFIPTVTWIDKQHKEREAFYKAETIRRITEASGEGAKAAMELMREEVRIKALKTSEGLKIAGLINLGVGIGLLIFLRALVPGAPVYLAGLIPGFIGVAMLVYVYVLAAPLQ